MRATLPGLIGLVCTLGSLLLVGGAQGGLPPPVVVPYAVLKLPETELARSGVLDLNRANAKALQALPGVGTATSAAIVLDRAKRGAFGSVDSLERVKGIGPSKLLAIRPFVYVSVPGDADADGGLSVPGGYARQLNE
ncbi:MAG: hypothetical protein ACI9VR_001963 [Cognaticolwellia sp.]